MATNKQTAQKTNKIWISSTGYRVLLILNSLMKKGRTIDELIEIVKNSPYANKSLSKDTIRLDIITLKSAGCYIKRPSKANNYKYELISHPFIMELSQLELDALIKVRNQIAKEITVEEVFALNDLYNKIAELTNSDFIADYIKNSAPLINIDRQIYKQLQSSKIKNKKIRVKYKSPKFGVEDLDIIPQKIVYENEKVYLWCYSYKYQTNSMLNVEKILEIKSISISENVNPSASYNVIYELYSDKVSAFEKKDYETIIESTPEKIVISAQVDNEFAFIQRILQFGADFKVISPGFFKEKLVDKLKLTLKGYEK